MEQNIIEISDKDIDLSGKGTATLKTDHLVVGVGEIGQAIAAVLGADTMDKDPTKNRFEERHYKYLHICIPYSDKFKEIVRTNQKKFTSKHTVIHSTVPVGTSASLGAVHSPVRGRHPHMVEGLMTFVKYFGGPDAREISEQFSKKGISVKCTPKSETTEALKLWDTTQYGWNIILEKIIWDYCEKNQVDFDLVYTDANRTYNDGYEKLGFPEFKKYVLKHVPGVIGGHCVVQNTDLFDSDVAKMIADYNKKIR